VACKLDATPAVPTLRVSSLAFAMAALVIGEITVAALARITMGTRVVSPIRSPRAIGDRRQAIVKVLGRTGCVMRKSRGLFARMQLPVAVLAVVSMPHVTSSCSGNRPLDSG
jgi:ABC-type branched-subunit amino acid transport system permease subunit